MQELSEALIQVAEKDLTIVDVEKHLRETAKKWAGYVLEHNCDDALKKGLEISRSIADYLNELKIDLGS